MDHSNSAEMPSVSLESLNVVKASEKPFEFQVESPDGTLMPIFISVFGSHSEKVTRIVASMLNDRRRKAAAREASGRRKKEAEFETVESDVEFGRRLAAARIAGWRGISDPFSPETALRLCQINPLIAEQVLAHSDDIGNFT